MTSAGEAHVYDADGVVLARDLLVSTILLHAKHRPNPGVQVGGAAVHVRQWQVGALKHDANPVVRLTVVPDVTLEFRLTPEVARDLGTALVQLVSAPPDAGSLAH